jgi:hypothetical protein
MPLTARENQLRDIARRLIESDQLPAVEPSSLSGGYGDGKPCSLCSLPIGNTEVEYELESAGKAISFPLHVSCRMGF